MKRLEYFFNLGNALSLKHRFNEAIIQYLKALDLKDGDSQMLSQTSFNLGNAYFFQNDFRKAADSYKQALALHPDNIDYNFNMANTAMELKDYETLIKHCKKVMSLDEDKKHGKT